MSYTINRHSTKSPATQYHLGPAWLLPTLCLGLLACGMGPSRLFRPTPTLEPLAIGVIVQGPGQPLDGTPATTSLLLQGQPVTSPSPSFIHTDTPVPAATPGPTVIPTFTLVPEAGLQVMPVAPATVSAAELFPTLSVPADNIYTGPLTGRISLLDPKQGFTLPVGQDQLEFKWQWLEDGVPSCQIQKGNGFEVRVWPEQGHPGLAAGTEVMPLGVIDAVKAQDLITSSCDPKTRDHRLLVNGLKSTPGVSMAGGSGHFFWDVAYIQLEPVYQVIEVSVPQDFFIPAPPGSTPIPTPTSSPIPIFVAQPGQRPEGAISLLTPASKHTFPAHASQVEFKWRWSGPVVVDSCQPAPDYGFELRIGPLGAAPMGVMDVVTEQDRIDCNPAAGEFYYIVPDLKQVPGIKASFAGEQPWTGQFQWDVALASLNPYVQPDTASLPHTFTISLSEYAGPFDPFGAPLKCGQFSSWIEAQAVFLASGGPDRDFHKLDPDEDGSACDELRR